MRLLLALACLACAAPQRPAGVVVGCHGWAGRGVVVSPMHVLTNRHLIDRCGDSEVYAEGHRLHLDSVSDEGDAALWATSGEVWSEWAIPGPAPVVGDTVCSARGCAKVIMRTSVGFVWDRQTRPGDSGSPLYDSRGRLVGLVVGQGTLAVGREVWGNWLKRLPRVCLMCCWAQKQTAWGCE